MTQRTALIRVDCEQAATLLTALRLHREQNHGRQVEHEKRLSTEVYAAWARLSQDDEEPAR